MKAERSYDGVPPTAGEGSGDVPIVRAMYRALGDGNDSILARCLDPQAEWIHPMVARLPFDGARRGLPAVVRHAFRRGGDGPEPRVSAETFLEFGDGVLVVGRFLGRDEAGGEKAEEPFLHECFVRGGKIVRIREYPARTGRALFD